jgi:anti-repressor protein
MSNQISNIFTFNGNSNIRVIGTAEKPLFVAKDVCAILDIADTAQALEGLDEDEKLMRTLHVSGQNREVWVLTEEGVYTLIIRSNKPQAKPFRRYVTHEVLPAIRKTGGYVTQDAMEKIISDPDFAIKMLSEIKELQNKNKEASNKIEKDRPLVAFAETIMSSNGTMLVRVAAKALSDKGYVISQNQLFNVLRNTLKWLNDDNEPYQSAIDLGYCAVKISTIQLPNNRDLTRVTPLITNKGLEKLFKYFSENSFYIGE